MKAQDLRQKSVEELKAELIGLLRLGAHRNADTLALTRGFLFRNLYKKPCASLFDYINSKLRFYCAAASF